MKPLTNDEVVALWKERIVKHADEIDGEADHGGHIWHSLWAGFVIGLGRRDLSDWVTYTKLGFPAEAEAGTYED